MGQGCYEKGTLMAYGRPAILGGQPVRSSLPQWPRPLPELTEVLEQLARSGDWGRYHGPYLERLREQLSQLLGGPHLFPVCSGSIGIELALRALKLPAGTEVVLAAYDYKPNFTSIVQLGLQPVLVDIRSEDGQLDAAQLDQACSERTGAILVSHLHGAAVNLPMVLSIARDRQLPVIEDACQCLGASVGGKMLGTCGDIGVFSFGGSKLLTSGRGGAICTARDDLAQRLVLETQRGNEIYPLSEMQAALLLPQLVHLSFDRQQRLCMRERLMPLLQQFGLQPLCASRQTSADSTAVGEQSIDSHRFACWYDPDHWGGLTRDQFVQAMLAEGIPCGSGFRALHRVHARRRYRCLDDLPVATRADERLVTWHHAFLLESAADVELEQALNQLAAAVPLLKDLPTC